MGLDAFGILYSGVFLAVVVGVYGYLPGSLTAPFLLAAPFRKLFAGLPGPNWGTSYVLWIPLPAALWGFCFGVVISLSGDLGPTAAEPDLYHLGVEGIIVATAVSAVLWPAVLLYWLPSIDVSWYGDEAGLKEIALAVGATAWYLLFVVYPAYMFVFFAGFGQAFSGT